MEHIVRDLWQRIEKNLKPNKVVMIFGARRVGKTVLTKQIVPRFKNKAMVFSGANCDTLALFENSSIGTYRNIFDGVGLLVIDEAQRIPDIGDKLKLILDEFQGIRIIVSGSFPFDSFDKSGESLVDRSVSFHLTAFSQKEISRTETALQTRQNLKSRLIFGSYPDVVSANNNEDRKKYLKKIMNAYLLKDILAVDGIRNASKMKELLKLVAMQTGREVSYGEMGKQIGMSKNTVEKYLDLFSKMFVIYRLGTFTKFSKEITKAGKWYFYDNGIRNAIIGSYIAPVFRKDIDALWENYLIGERLKKNLNENSNKELYFWRSYDQQKIDLIEVSKDGISAFDFKWDDTITNVPQTFSMNYPEATYHVVNKKNYLEFIQ